MFRFVRGGQYLRLTWLVDVRRNAHASPDAPAPPLCVRLDL